METATDAETATLTETATETATEGTTETETVTETATATDTSAEEIGQGDCENPILITAEVPTLGAITADDGRYALTSNIDSTCTRAANRADIYEWRVTESGTYDIQVEGNFEVMLAYGDTCESGNTIACSDAITDVEQINEIQAEAGETYYVIVSGFDDTEVGTYTLTIKQPPPSGTCDHPFFVNTGEIMNGDTTGAQDVLDVGCDRDNSQYDHIYQWTPDKTSIYSIEVDGTNFWERVAILDSCGADVEPLECVSGEIFDISRIEHFEAVKDTTYTVVVTGRSPNVTDQGAYTLNIEEHLGHCDTLFAV